MAQKREGYAPFSIEREAGVQSATVNGTIDVVQEIRPTLTTGFIDEKGDWKGLKSSDEQFHAFGIDEAVPNTGAITQPQSVTGIGLWPIDMTGFRDIFIAINPSNGGNYAIAAIMGPENFANLRDVNAGTNLKFRNPNQTGTADFDNLITDGTEALTADVWNIFNIQSVASNQKLLQFKITNNSGGESTIQTAFMRLV